MSRSALIAVDCQADYLFGGSLGLPLGVKVITNLATYAKAMDLVVASRNLYPTDSVRFTAAGGSWPPHCVKKTKGANLAPEIKDAADYIITKGEDAKQGGYSAFEAGTLRPIRLLEEILADEDISHVLIGGYLLEYCVSQTAFDANALGLNTEIRLDAVQAWEDDDIDEAVAKLTKAGVKVE